MSLVRTYVRKSTEGKIYKLANEMDISVYKVTEQAILLLEAQQEWKRRKKLTLNEMVLKQRRKNNESASAVLLCSS